MSSPLRNNKNRLIGFDTAGELFLENERIIRGIYPEYESLYRSVLETCENNNLFQQGIVNTRVSTDYSDLDPAFGLVLEHEKIHFITYPHEWSASMLKDAAIFHIDLFTRLEKYGLTLKDWHPYNILFKDTTPVFIDFLSIISTGNLEKEEYLKPPNSQSLVNFGTIWDERSRYLFEMYRRMYLPYFLLPLEVMAQKKHKRSRELLFQTTLNASTMIINPHDVFSINLFRRIAFEVREFLKKISLLEQKPSKVKFFEALRRELFNLDVKPATSAYVQYYDQKDENFDFRPTPQWTDKQIGVYAQILQLKPMTVLDIACNTGWFSILSAKNGCTVVAVDIDESCVDRLYEYAKNEHLPILPLVIDITQARGKVLPLVQNDPVYLKRLEESTPLLISTEKRLQCDMVLVLALIHHLILGQNMNFPQLIQLLGTLSKNYLILEFVPKTDALVMEEPDFFPAYKSNPDAFDWYTLENLVGELEKIYKKVDIADSYPGTRKLLICIK